MEPSELDRQIAEVVERGFDESFILFCADTFSSFDYPVEKLAAARMHAFYLRLFMELHLSGEAVRETGRLPEAVKMIGEKSMEETLSLPQPSGEAFCRLFVRNWCRYCSLEGGPAV